MSSALPGLIFTYLTYPPVQEGLILHQGCVPEKWCTNPVQAGLILHQGYVPEKWCANRYHAN